MQHQRKSQSKETSKRETSHHQGKTKRLFPFVLVETWTDGRTKTLYFYRQSQGTPQDPVPRSLKLLLVLEVDAVVDALDLLGHGLHFLSLALPLFGGHLLLAAEELLVGLAVGTAEAVPEGGELAVVVVKVPL